MGNMSENKFSIGGSPCKETVCIEANRILDSCRDRDCYENTRVYLTDLGNDIIERTGTIRTKDAVIAWTHINIDPVQFNRGFYSVGIKFYVKLTFEACIGGGRSQEFEGIAVVEKRVILFGGESNVCIFRSTPADDSFCRRPEPCSGTRNVPEAVVEVVDPIVLSTRIVEKHDCHSCCNCCCCVEDIPESICGCLDGCLSDHDGIERYLAVTLGIFSIVKIVRHAHYLINATEYCVPDKECVVAQEDNPCRIFHNMEFPIGEFCPPDHIPLNSCGKEKGCGCQ